jgi:hypothetical protein
LRAAAREGEMATTSSFGTVSLFQNLDPNYDAWLNANPAGFVLNCH